MSEKFLDVVIPLNGTWLILMRFYMIPCVSFNGEAVAELYDLLRSRFQDTFDS